jgi:hypothetical protein
MWPCRIEGNAVVSLAGEVSRAVRLVIGTDDALKSLQVRLLKMGYYKVETREGIRSNRDGQPDAI